MISSFDGSILTIVIRRPADEQASAAVSAAVKALEPFTTGVSIEDEMTVLDMVERHEDMPAHIIDEARERARLAGAKA